MPLMISKQQMAQYVDGINVRLFLIYWHSHCLLLVQMNQLMLACVVLTACVTFLNALKCYVGSGETIEEKECSGSCFTSTQSMKGLRMGLWSQYTSLLSSSFTFHCNSVRLTCCVKRLLDLTSSRPTYSKYIHSTQWRAWLRTCECERGIILNICSKHSVLYRATQPQKQALFFSEPSTVYWRKRVAFYVFSVW